MKKIAVVSLSVIAFIALIALPTKSFAVATIPNTSVWFTPATAAPGAAINLNALVYNNQTQSATVTVKFTIDKGVIGSQTALIAAQSAKTVVQPWLMPANTTTVTVAVSAAVNSQKENIPALIGTLGTFTVAPGTTSPINSSGISGIVSQVTTWFNTTLAKIETFRVQQAAAYATGRDQAKASLGITPSQASASTSNTIGVPPLQFNSATQYITYIFDSACASFFGSAAIFYIGLILILLLVLRFLANVFF